MRSVRGRQIAMVFQDPTMTLNPVLRIDTQMMEAVQAHERVDRRTALARARDALVRVGIPAPDERLRTYPHELSGGMRQRIAIAIALLHSPDLIVVESKVGVIAPGKPEVFERSRLALLLCVSRPSTTLSWLPAVTLTPCVPLTCEPMMLTLLSACSETSPPEKLLPTLVVLSWAAFIVVVVVENVPFFVVCEMKALLSFAWPSSMLRLRPALATSRPLPAFTSACRALMSWPALRIVVPLVAIVLPVSRLLDALTILLGTMARNELLSVTVCSLTSRLAVMDVPPQLAPRGRSGSRRSLRLRPRSCSSSDLRRHDSDSVFGTVQA
jgi:hypothetical protein